MDSDVDADDDEKFAFTVTLKDTTISGTYGDMTFEDGVAKLELKHNDKATASGLPSGIGYTVEEVLSDAQADVFELKSVTGDTGATSAQMSSAIFTNTRKTHALEISKTVVSPFDSEK